MSKRDMIFLNIGVGACSSIVTTFLVLYLLSISATSAPLSQPTGAAEGLLASAQQVVQQTKSPAAGLGTVLQFCRSDAGKFCAQKTTASEQLECLHDHFDEVSSACGKLLQKMRDSFAPCKADIDKFCATAGYGGGRMIACLQAQSSQLSAACAKRVGTK
jgi:hypothetical protein